MGEYTTGDRDIKIKIENEKNVTIDDIVNEANKIFAYVRSKKIKKDDLEAIEHMTSELRKAHPEFSKSYPIVFKYMCELQLYNSKALRLYLNKIKRKPWTSISEYLDSQADYVVLLHRFIRKWKTANLSQFRQNVRDALQKEHDDYVQRVEQATKEIDEKIAALQKCNSEELREYLKIYGPSLLREEHSDKCSDECNDKCSTEHSAEHNTEHSAEHSTEQNADTLLLTVTEPTEISCSADSLLAD